MKEIRHLQKEALLRTWFFNLKTTGCVLKLIIPVSFYRIIIYLDLQMIGKYDYLKICCDFLCSIVLISCYL